MQSTLSDYLKIYNHHIVQRNLQHLTPIQSMKEWRKKKSELFHKNVYNQAGLDTYALYAGLIYARVGYVIALTADYLFGGIVTFILNKRISFQVKERATSTMVWPMVKSIFITYLINLAVLSYLVEKRHANAYLAQAVSLVIVAISSFLLQNFHVFNAVKR